MQNKTALQLHSKLTSLWDHKYALWAKAYIAHEFRVIDIYFLLTAFVVSSVPVELEN